MRFKKMLNKIKYKTHDILLTRNCNKYGGALGRVGNY